MALLSKKMKAVCLGLVGLSTLLALPVSSFADCWNCWRPHPAWGPNHQWHPAGRWARDRDCRRVFSQRYCRNNRGWQQCYTVQRVRFICVY